MIFKRRDSMTKYTASESIFQDAFVSAKGQFHQHYMSTFAQILLHQKNFKHKMKVQKSFVQNFVKKSHAWNIGDTSWCADCAVKTVVATFFSVLQWCCIVCKTRTFDNECSAWTQQLILSSASLSFYPLHIWLSFNIMQFLASNCFFYTYKKCIKNRKC